MADFMESLTKEQDKLVQMGTIKSTKDLLSLKLNLDYGIQA